jgi:hypothetical protein
MGILSTDSMQQYLSKSISSLNRNKMNGLLAEIDFRVHLNSLGFADRVSAGGWIARCEGEGNFSHQVVAFFPETIQPGQDYSPSRQLPQPEHGLHTICSTLHQIGIHSYYCSPVIENDNDCSSIKWYYTQLGLPTQQQYQKFPGVLYGFNRRIKRYNFLRYDADSSLIPEQKLSEEFSKEHLRITFQNSYFSEMSDIDGILWGNQYTYPLEIKEKTSARDNRIGEYFGIDIGPFVKLAFYAAKKGNLHSLFVVREITDVETRQLVKWWFITFDRLAQFASWVFTEGGRNMQGGRSATVKIPKAEFKQLDTNEINVL